MGSYLVNFSIYTLAMVGVIFGALFVFKSVMTGRGFSKKSEFLNVEDSISLSPRKTLYVIKAGEQKFLVAADLDRTSLIAKLDGDIDKNSGENIEIGTPLRQDKSFELSSLDGLESLDEFSSVMSFRKENKTKKPMMRGLAEKLSAI